jgi:hypothetical protein
LLAFDSQLEDLFFFGPDVVKVVFDVWVLFLDLGSDRFGLLSRQQVRVETLIEIPSKHSLT